jgi:hypothetical protein
MECIACEGIPDELARGWRGYLTDAQDEPATVLWYCPECAEREFGPFGRSERVRDDCSGGPTLGSRKAAAS